MKQFEYQITGVLLDNKFGKPIAKVRVCAFDRDFLFKDALGECYTDEDGKYQIQFNRSDFSGLFGLERSPDIFILVFDEKGTLLHSTEKSTVVNADRLTTIDLVIRGKEESKATKQRPKLSGKLQFLMGLDSKQRYAKKRDEVKRLSELMKAYANPKEKEEIQFPVSTLHGYYHPELEKYHPHRSFKIEYISAFIKFHGNKTDLQRLGIHVRTRAGNIFTVFIPLHLLDELEAMPAVEYIELPKPMFPNLSRAMNIHELTAVHTDSGMPGDAAITGNGVIVGIYDSVFDLYHLNFRNNDGGGTDDNGTTRLLRLWDQNFTTEGAENTPNGNNPVIPFNYGVEYTEADVNAELNKPADTDPYLTVRHGGSVNSHGTQVSGCAVSNGRAPIDGGFPAGTYTGSAPNADIIFVGWKSGHHNDPVGVTPYSDNSFLADGIDYIFRQAAVTDLPCVVNVSESDDQGPHDGSSLGQEFIDNLLDGPGKAICLASGNSGTHESHAAGDVAVGVATDVVLNYVDAEGFRANNDDDVVDCWYDGHDRFSIVVTDPGGNDYGPVLPGDSETFDLPSGETITINSMLDNPQNGDNQIQIITTASGANVIPAGDWTFALTGITIINGHFDMWVDRNNRDNNEFLAPYVNTATTLGDSSCTRKPITVGATTSAENITTFSGRGPTRDGRIKPEIVAFGNSIVTTRSRNMRLADPGDYYDNTSGTSFASPLVAGAAALIFECKGAGLSWFDVKQLLTNNADSTGLMLPNGDYGWGRLRASNLCADGDTDVDLWLRMIPGDMGEEPFAGAYIWESPDIEVLDAGLNPIANPVFGEETYIRVTARNRGLQKAKNVEVNLFWGDPATHMPYPDAWQGLGFFTDPDADGNYLNQTNRIIIPEIDANGSASVIYRWLVPEPGTNIRGDDHFCLLAFAENEIDRLEVAEGQVWWPMIRTDNNIAARNVHVQNMEDDGDAVFSFIAEGTEWIDSLIIETDWREVSFNVIMPKELLPIRDMEYINRLGRPQSSYPPCKGQKTLPYTGKYSDKNHRELFGVVGAKSVYFKDDLVILEVNAPRLNLEKIMLNEKARVPIRIEISRKSVTGKPQNLRVSQFADGVLMGGVSLALQKG